MINKGIHVVSLKGIRDSHTRPTYRLFFGTNIAWDFSAEPQLQEWINRFAKILTLPESDDEQDCFLHWRTAKRYHLVANAKTLESGATAENSLESLRTILLSTSSSGDISAFVDNCDDNDITIINMFRLFYPVYRSVIRSGGAPFHAAMTELEGKAYLLAGVSGSGKSTCSNRLPVGWISRCDDEVLVIREANDRYRVHPMPTWSHFMNGGVGEKSWDVTQGVPLAGIFFLEHSKDRDSAVPLLNKAENARAMNASALQIWQKYSNFSNREQRQKMHCHIFENVCQMAHHIPAYMLSITLEGKFWIEMEKCIGRAEGLKNKDLQA